MEVSEGSVHIFRGGEKRRKYLEKVLGVTVTLCKNPPPESFFNTTWAFDPETGEINEV